MPAWTQRVIDLLEAISNSGRGTVTYEGGGSGLLTGALHVLNTTSGDWVEACSLFEERTAGLAGFPLGHDPAVSGVFVGPGKRLSTSAGVTNWSAGGFLYVSATTGLADTVPPAAGSGEYSRIVCQCLPDTGEIWMFQDTMWSKLSTS